MENNNKTMTLCLGCGTFEAMERDFNMILRRTLGEMEQKQSEAAELTVKVNIELRRDMVPDYTGAADDVRDATLPVFAHKVSSVMKIKNETSGTLAGNFELIWDPDAGDYLLAPINSGQQSLYEDDEPEAGLPPMLPEAPDPDDVPV